MVVEVAVVKAVTEAVSEDIGVVTRVISRGVVTEEVSEAPGNKAGMYFSLWRQRFSHGMISIFTAG